MPCDRILCRFGLRLEIKLSLESPNLIWCCQAHGQSPHLVTFESVPEARGLPSIGITRPPWYYAPLRLPPGPETFVSVVGHEPAPGKGLPRCPSYLPDILFQYPGRLEQALVTVACPFFGGLSNIGRVGIYNFPLGACSRFTRITACQIAAALKAYVLPRGFSKKVSRSYCLGSYRDETTISRAELASAGNLHSRGAPIYCGFFIPPESRRFAIVCLKIRVRKTYSIPLISLKTASQSLDHRHHG